MVIDRQPETPDDETRTVWIRCHPAIFSTVHSTLKQAVSSTLDALKKYPKYSQNSYAVEVIDLRDSINVFEITGPKSSQVIYGALTPTIANHTGEFKKVRSMEVERNRMVLTFIIVLVVIV
jgi:ribonuclease P/MRP protein subunit POP1